MVSLAEIRSFGNRPGAFAALATVVFAFGCGEDTSLTIKEKLEVAMLGQYSSPADAAGNADPRHQTYNLTDVSITASDGEVIDLYDLEEPTELKIVNRSQIIFEAELADYIDKTFSAITVTFDPTVVGGGKIESEMSATLPTPAISLSESFKIATATELRFTIGVEWKNTVTRDEEADPATETMTAPTFVLELTGGD